MTVTIKEVAKKARVSTATVSRVFNNSEAVDEKTRRRVRAVAEKMRYVPSALGRSLSMKRTDAIGMLLPDLYGEFFSEVIRGADQAAQQQHYHLFVSSSHNHRADIEAALQMMRGRVDGLIVMSPNIDAPTLDTNLPKNLPAVLLNCYVESDNFDSLNIDNFNGARQMVEHLIAHGHRRVAVLKGPEKNSDARARAQGYRQALADAGLAHGADLEEYGDFSEATGYAATQKLIALRQPPTAIFACNDAMAIGALSALREAGIRVPQDMALAGFDDIPVAKFLAPALSSVHVAINDLGRMAVHKLLHAVREKNRHAKEDVLIPITLALRESCGCPKRN